MEFIFIILVVVAATHFGWNLRGIYEDIKLRRANAELSENLQKLEKHYVDTYVNLKLEKVNDMIYVYDMNDTFICQGKTRKEINELFRNKYPNKNGMIHEGEKLWKELA